MAFTLDGNTLAGGSGRSVQLWDVADPNAPNPLGVPPDVGQVRSVAFASDGTVLAVSGNVDARLRSIVIGK